MKKVKKMDIQMIAVLLVATLCIIPKSTSAFSPTLTFEPASHFLLVNGEKIKYDISCSTRFADLNGDGRLDMMVATGGRLWLHLAADGGRFHEAQALRHPDGQPVDTGLASNRGTTMAYGDFDGDGTADILLTMRSNLYLLRRDGVLDGIPTFRQQELLRKLDTNRFDLFDYDKDGASDIITGNFVGYFQVYRNVDESLQAPVRVNEFTAGAYTSYPRVVDINGDNEPEIFYSLNWGFFRMFARMSSGKYQEFKLTLEVNGDLNVRAQFKEHQSPEIADADGDGMMDLITSGDTGDIVFFRGIDTVQKSKVNIENIFNTFPETLGEVLENDDTVYNAIYDNNRQLQNYVTNPVFPGSVKNNIYIWYLQLIGRYPQYLSRQQWADSALAYLAGYMWVVTLESQPDRTRHRKLLSIVTQHTGYAAQLLEDRGMALVNNDRAPENKVKLVYDYMMLKNPAHFSVSALTQDGHIGGRPWKYGPQRNSSNNIFTGATGSENSFPGDCGVCGGDGRSPRIMTFMAGLAHLIAHNELDQKKAAAYNLTLFRRKYKILKQATVGHVIWRQPVYTGYDVSKTKALFKEKGWWDGSENWGTVLERHFNSGPGKDLLKNSIRNNLGYFVMAPQEAFATLANQYASDTKLMLDFAMERAAGGHPLCMDWFFLIADYYSMGGSTIPMFVVNETAEMRKYSATVGRDSRGYIDSVTVDQSLPGPANYNCVLGNGGFVESCTSS